MRRSDGSATVSYAYVGTGTTAWRTSSGATTLDATLGPDESRLALDDGSAFAWLLPDLHGNVAAGIDSAETTVSDAWRYDGYGRSVASTTSSGLANPWTYQGRLDLAPAGEDPFYAAGARAYDPNLGVFSQLDSLAGNAQDPLSLNRYLYAAANPATLIDPDGHMAVRVSGGRVDLDQQRAYYASHGSAASLRLRYQRINRLLEPTTTARLGGSAITSRRMPGRFGNASAVAHSVSTGEANTFLDAAVAFGASAVIAGAIGLAAGAVCVGTVGIGCAVVGAGLLTYGTVSTVGTLTNPTVSEHDKWVTAAGFAGGIVGGGYGFRGGPGLRPTNVGSPRLPQDIAISANAPRALPLGRSIGGSPSQNAALQSRIAEVIEQGATDLRVNQQQVNINGERVGINRPDLQFTMNGQRYYEEWDTVSSTRGYPHGVRLGANDPLGIINLYTAN